MNAPRKAVFVTGGAQRVGEALSLYFAEAGYDVALHYHRSDENAKSLRARIESMGRECVLLPRDLTDLRGLEGLMRAALEAMPHCRALINNASVFERAALMQSDIALYERHMALNFAAPMFLTQAFARLAGRGCVVNILDTDVMQSQTSHFMYLLSKKALAECTRMAARELGPDVRVNGVCPGILLPSGDLDSSYISALTKRLPMGKTGAVGDACQAVEWLIENPSLTGQLIFTDGGQHLL